MHPIGVILLAILLYFVLFGTRRGALIAAVAGVLYLTQGQGYEILDVNLYAGRILGTALFARVMLRREFSFSSVTRIDHALLILYGYATVVFLLRSESGQAGNIAQALDALFYYFGFRGLIKDEEDLRWLLRTLIVLLVPFAFLIGIERVTGHNPFAFMGGIAEGNFIRDDKIRCMGSFRYPVTLGTFAATFLALYIGLWRSKTERRFAYIGIALCLWIVWATNSGGSFSALGVAVIAWMLWYARKNMRAVRWGILGLLAALALVMKAPVWYILDRVTFGGNAWHRAYLIDCAFRNLDKWWLVGMPLQDTANWFPYILVATGGADITNQYLVFGIDAGIGAIVLFILLISRAFGQIGSAMTKLDPTVPEERTTGFLLWGLGSLMAVHLVNWFGISYFDQVYVIWFLQLAAVTSITERILREPYVSQPITPPEFVPEYAERGFSNVEPVFEKERF